MEKRDAEKRIVALKLRTASEEAVQAYLGSLGAVPVAPEGAAEASPVAEAAPVAAAPASE